MQRLFKRIAKKFAEITKVKFVTIEESTNEIVSVHFNEIGIFLITTEGKKLKFEGKKSINKLIDFYNNNVSNETKISRDDIKEEWYDDYEIPEFEEEEDSNKQIDGTNFSDGMNDYNPEQIKKEWDDALNELNELKNNNSVNYKNRETPKTMSNESEKTDL